MSADLSALVLQGTKPVEDLQVGEVTDGFNGRSRVQSRELRTRKDMAPLVMLNMENGEWLRFEPGFPVAFYDEQPNVAA